MFRLFLLTLFLFVSLEASSSTKLLERANSMMKSNTQSDTFRAYDDYKSLYLRSLVDNDSSLKLESLKGIVASGERLHIDVSKYSKELQKLQSQKSSYNKPESKDMKKTQNIEDMHVQPLHKLKSINWKDNRLLLEFNKELSSNQIEYFTLHNKSKGRYRYVFDIKTSMLTAAQSIKSNDIDRIKIAQFNPQTLRLVVDHTSEIEVEHRVDSNILDIALKLERVGTTLIPEKKVRDRDKIIVIDPGHGGKDPGAVGYRKYREKIVVMDVSKELQKILESRGYKVYMTRDRDKFIKLRERTKFANKKNAIFL